MRQERWGTGLWDIKKTAEAGGKLTCSDLLEGAFGVTCEVSHEMHFGERLRPRATGVLQRTGGFGMPYSWYRARWYSCLSSPVPITLGDYSHSCWIQVQQDGRNIVKMQPVLQPFLFRAQNKRSDAGHRPCLERPIVRPTSQICRLESRLPPSRVRIEPLDFLASFKTKRVASRSPWRAFRTRLSSLPTNIRSLC